MLQDEDKGIDVSKCSSLSLRDLRQKGGTHFILRINTKCELLQRCALVKAEKQAKAALQECEVGLVQVRLYIYRRSCFAISTSSTARDVPLHAASALFLDVCHDNHNRN